MDRGWNSLNSPYALKAPDVRLMTQHRLTDKDCHLSVGFGTDPFGCPPPLFRWLAQPVTFPRPGSLQHVFFDYLPHSSSPPSTSMFAKIDGTIILTSCSLDLLYSTPT